MEKLNYHFGSTKHECYSINRNNKSSFTIHHYAGKVSYCALGFLEKNRDTLSDSVVDMFKHSQDDLIRLLFHGNASDGANSLSKGVRHSEWNCFFILRFIVVTTSYCCRERCSKSIDCRCTISSKYFEKVSQDENSFLITRIPYKFSWIECVHPIQYSCVVSNQINKNKHIYSMKYSFEHRYKSKRTEGKKKSLTFDHFSFVTAVC